MIISEKIRQAAEDLRIKYEQYYLTDNAFEGTAYFEMKAAEAKLNALIKEAKGGESGWIKQNFKRR